MASNLFGEYFKNPTKSYIYSNIQCNGSDADMSFDIIGSEGVISDSDNSLSHLDLSDVHVPVSQYTGNLRILDPYSYMYIKGEYFGETKTSKTFGRIVVDDVTPEDWMYRGIIFFVIKYTDIHTGRRAVESIKCSGSLEVGNEKTFIEVLNEYFGEKSIPITVTYEDGYITFAAYRLNDDGTEKVENGYDFIIDHVLFWNVTDPDYDGNLIKSINEWMVDNGYAYSYGWDDEYLSHNGVTPDNPYIERNVYSSLIVKSDYSRLYNLMRCLDSIFSETLESNKVYKTWLYEDFNRRISPRKYRNGASKGILVKATYPVYNAEDIKDVEKSLKIVHVADSVEEWYMVPQSVSEGTCVAVRKIIDVVDSYHSEYDQSAYDKWLGKYSAIDRKDLWIESGEIPSPVTDMFNDWMESSVPYMEQAEKIYRDIETREAMGIEGYCAYCTKNKLWKNMGQFYCITTADESDEPDVKNLVSGLVIYNPNPFPVQINYLTFA